MSANDPRRLIRPLSSLQKTALYRAEGYLDHCLALGRLDPATLQVQFTPEAWRQLREQYRFIIPANCPMCQKRNQAKA
jgi:hypothetical protein